MEQTHSYRPLCLSLYLNYFVHGIGVLILAQNMDALAARWGSLADVMSVIGMLGIGRLIVLFVSGKLSDKYGRKPFVLLGMVTYIAFFLGILVSPTTTVAYIFGILAGIANSFLDAGTYPALIESYPESASTVTVLLKAFISAGQFLLPLFIGMLVVMNAWYGWSFIAAMPRQERVVRLSLLRRRRYFGLELPHHAENVLSVHESRQERHRYGRRRRAGSTEVQMVY